MVNMCIYIMYIKIDKQVLIISTKVNVYARNQSPLVGLLSFVNQLCLTVDAIGIKRGRCQEEVVRERRETKLLPH
jgi:hypothetical protein